MEVLGEAERSHQLGAEVAAAHLDPVGVRLADATDGLAGLADLHGLDAKARVVRACPEPGATGGDEMSHRTAWVAALTTGAMAFTFATADATNTVRIASQITIESHGLNFHGRVKSENAGCKD